MPVTAYLDVSDPAEMARYGFPVPGGPTSLDAATAFKASILIDAYIHKTMFQTVYTQERHRLPYGRNITRLFNLPVVSISAVEGRNSYGRRSDQRVLSGRAPFYGIVPNLYGVPQWVTIDTVSIDLDPQSGEIWLPTNIAFGVYGEVRVTYTAGYTALTMPEQIKAACANICKTMRLRGIPDVGSLSVEEITVNYINPASGPSFLSEDTRRMLDRYVAKGMG